MNRSVTRTDCDTCMLSGILEYRNLYALTKHSFKCNVYFALQLIYLSFLDVNAVYIFIVGISIKSECYEKLRLLRSCTQGRKYHSAFPRQEHRYNHEEGGSRMNHRVSSKMPHSDASILRFCEIISVEMTRDPLHLMILYDSNTEVLKVTCILLRPTSQTYIPHLLSYFILNDDNQQSLLRSGNTIENCDEISSSWNNL